MSVIVQPETRIQPLRLSCSNFAVKLWLVPKRRAADHQPEEETRASQLAPFCIPLSEIPRNHTNTCAYAIGGLTGVCEAFPVHSQCARQGMEHCAAYRIFSVSRSPAYASPALQAARASSPPIARLASWTCWGSLSLLWDLDSVVCDGIHLPESTCTV